MITFAIYATYSISRYRQFLPAGYDLGIFDQAVHNYARFRPPLVVLKGPHYNILGDHFHPIVAALVPFYWIWNDPRTLLLAQSAALTASAAIVYRFCKRHLGRRWALPLAAGYALGWPLQGMADFDFHEVAFAVPLLAWAIDALDRRRDKELVASCLLLLLVREDLGLVVLFVGMARALGRPRRTGFALIIAGVAGYIIATALVIPHFATSGHFSYWSYDALGPNFPSAVETILVHPLRSAHLFFTPETKLRTLLWLLAPLAFLSLRSPYTLTVLPLLAERFFSSRPHLWTTEFHYSAVAWPILFLGAIDGARRLGITKPVLGRALLSALVIAVPVAGTASDAQLWPLHRLLTGSAFRITAHMRDQARLLRAVPSNTCVEADDRLAAQLTHRDLVSLPTLLGRDPDFIALDMSQPEVGYRLPSPQSVKTTAISHGYEPILRSGSLLLLRRPGYGGPTAACRP